MAHLMRQNNVYQSETFSLQLASIPTDATVHIISHFHSYFVELWPLFVEFWSKFHVCAFDAFRPNFDQFLESISIFISAF